MGCLADARHDRAGDFSNTPYFLLTRKLRIPYNDHVVIKLLMEILNG